MIKKRSNSLQDLKTEGRGFISAEGPSPRRKKTRIIPMRSRSLVDYSSSIRSRGPRFYYPTQDDIYRILDETSQAARPSTGSKRLSPFTPLPAIGTRMDTPEPTVNKNDRGTPPPLWEGRDIEPNTSPTPRLIREGTYEVLEPKFVKGPTPIPQTPPALPNMDRKRSKKQKKKKSNDIKAEKRQFNDPFKESSGTVLFGPRVPAHNPDDDDLEDVWEESESVTKSPLLSGEDKASLISTDNTMQRVYSQRNHWLASAVSNITIGEKALGAAGTIPRVQQTFWFD